MRKFFITKRISRVITFLLIGYIFITITMILYQNRHNFVTFDYWQQYPNLRKVFYGSQYKTKNFTGFIPDETAYAYVGGALIRGENPIFNIPEAPPLGKYLIGLSAVLFNNANIFVVLVAGLAGLLMIYLLGRQILGTSFISLLPVAALTSEPLYRNQYDYAPLFDLAQLFFLVSVFYFFNKAITAKSGVIVCFAISSLFLGFFISTKFYASGAPIVVSLLLVLILNKYWHKLILFIMTLWIPIAVLLATYLRVFAFGPMTIREFLGIQKWIFIYWHGALNLPFTVWDLLLFNRWHTWWGNRAILHDSNWIIVWPIITVISAVTIALYVAKRIPRKKEIEIIMAFVICYGAFLSVGLPSVRYFVIYIPFLYIITLYLLQYLFGKYFRQRHARAANDTIKK